MRKFSFEYLGSRLLLYPALCCLALISSSASLAGELPTDIKLAYETASSKNLPMLIAVRTHWCPPCNDLSETVFALDEFSRKASAFVTLSVDGDDESSWPIQERYKVRGYPTVIFASPKGDEILRLTGSTTWPEFSRLMDIALRRKDKPFIRACEGRTSDELWICANSCAANDGFGGARHAYRKLLGKARKGSMRWLTAKTWLLEQETNPSARAKGLSDLMRSFPASPMAPLWASSYLEGLADGTKPDSTLLDPILASTPVILKDPTLGEFGLTPHDVLYTRAEVLEALERKDEAKAAWKEMADSLRERQKTLPKGVSGRSVALPLISALEFSGQPDAALALASDYRKRFPKDPTFHRKAAGVLKRAQRMPEALAVAKEAYALSYGDNLLMNAQLLAELQLSSGQPAAARETIEKATTDFKGDKKLTPRTKRYLDALNKMLPKTAAATPPDL